MSSPSLDTVNVRALRRNCLHLNSCALFLAQLQVEVLRHVERSKPEDRSVRAQNAVYSTRLTEMAVSAAERFALAMQRCAEAHLPHDMTLLDLMADAVRAIFAAAAHTRIALSIGILSLPSGGDWPADLPEDLAIHFPTFTK